MTNLRDQTKPLFTLDDEEIAVRRPFTLDNGLPVPTQIQGGAKPSEVCVPPDYYTESKRQECCAEMGGYWNGYQGWCGDNGTGDWD